MKSTTCYSILFFLFIGLAALAATASPDANGAWGWESILPATLAILLAFLFRQVFLALFFGIWVGAWLLNGLTLESIFSSMLDVVDPFLMRALVPEDGSTDHMAIVIFTLLTGGMIGVISRNGGMAGIVRYLSRFANNRKRGQASAYGLGFLIFFDDYANTLIVGKTMQPLMDKLKISREKLAFLVDSTAAPVAALALASTWIGFQVSLMDDAIAGIDGFEMQGYNLFLSALPYSFYPILMLVFIAIVIKTGRDFGPMLTAERAVQAGEKSLGHMDDAQDDAEEATPKAWLGLLPILTLIFMTMGGLWWTGEGSGIKEILGSADPFSSMVWASISALLLALLISVATKALSIGQAMAAMERGFAPMLMAVMILTFAWGIADVNAALGTADYVTSLLGDTMAAEWLPLAVFAFAALTAFATGTSWGTMAILIPLILPLGWQLLSNQGMADAAHYHILYAAVASVMAGAVWGDHCSPISDTTILSSLASNCSHIEHVRTQLPYALAVAGTAIATCIIPAGFGLHWAICLGLGCVGLYLITRKFGKAA